MTVLRGGRMVVGGDAPVVAHRPRTHRADGRQERAAAARRTRTPRHAVGSRRQRRVGAQPPMAAWPSATPRSRFAPARSWASPACRATVRRSCSKRCSGLRPLVSGEVHIAGDSHRAGAADRRTAAPERSTFRRIRSADAVIPGLSVLATPRARRSPAAQAWSRRRLGRGPAHVRRRARRASGCRWPTSAAGSIRCRAATSSG